MALATPALEIRNLHKRYGDLVCRGCKRFHYEVINWNGYNEEEKRAVWRSPRYVTVRICRDRQQTGSEKPVSYR